MRKGAEHLKTGMEALVASQEKQHDLGVLHGQILQTLGRFETSLASFQQTTLEHQETLKVFAKEMAAPIETSSFPAENREIASLRESLKMIDAETEQIIKKLDGLR